VRALNGVTLRIGRGETLGLVGESGCGKSVTARAILNMVPKPGRIAGGSIRLVRRSEAGGADEASGDDTVELTSLDPKGREIRAIRGKDVSMVFQEPMTSLSPVHTIGNQIIESIVLHQGLTPKEARGRAIEALNLV